MAPEETETRIYVFEELGLEFIYLIKTRTRRLFHKSEDPPTLVET